MSIPQDVMTVCIGIQHEPNDVISFVADQTPIKGGLPPEMETHLTNKFGIEVAQQLISSYNEKSALHHDPSERFYVNNMPSPLDIGLAAEADPTYVMYQLNVSNWFFRGDSNRQIIVPVKDQHSEILFPAHIELPDVAPGYDTQMFGMHISDPAFPNHPTEGFCGLNFDINVVVKQDEDQKETQIIIDPKIRNP